MGSWHVLPSLRELFALRWNLAEATVIALGVFLASLFLLGLRLRDTMAVPTAEAKDLPNSGIKKLRKVSESEVIAVDLIVRPPVVSVLHEDRHPDFHNRPPLGSK